MWEVQRVQIKGGTTCRECKAPAHHTARRTDMAGRGLDSGKRVGICPTCLNRQSGPDGRFRFLEEIAIAS
jgi:hypothetical protein